MHTLTIYYITKNNGDGSASAHFFDSEKLAEWVLEKEGEDGFCDSYVDSMTFASESPISPPPEVRSSLEYLCQEFYSDFSDAEDFISKFFPGGVPQLTTFVQQAEVLETHQYVHVFVNRDQLVTRVFMDSKHTEKLISELQSLSRLK